MTMIHNLVGLTLAGVTCGSVAAEGVPSQQQAGIQLSTQHSVVAGSAEMRAVRQWLSQRGAPHASAVGIDIASWRSAALSRERFADARVGAMPSDVDAMAPLPSVGRAGDVIDVEALTSLGKERWSYAWDAEADPGEWVLQRYDFNADLAGDFRDTH